MARKSTRSSLPRRGPLGSKSGRRSNLALIKRFLRFAVAPVEMTTKGYSKLPYIAIVSIIIGALGFAGFVSAGTKTAGPLQLDYEGEVLFSKTNLAPGDSVSKNITVTNNGTVEHSFALGASDVSGDLADSVNIETWNGSNLIWSKSLLELSSLPEEGAEVVGNITPGESADIIVGASVASSAGNEIQNKQVEFDLNFGTQEPEAVSGEYTTAQLGSVLLGYGRESASQDASEDQKDEKPENIIKNEGETKGASTENGAGKNKWLLLIVPGSAIGGLSFVRSCKRRNILLPLFFGAAAFLLSNYISGDMSQETFEYYLGAEVLLAGSVKTIMKDRHKEWYSNYRTRRTAKRSN